MALDFNKFAAKGNEFMNELAVELGYSGDTSRAGRVLKSVLHALRDHVTVHESVQLLAQLPMFLKAVYVENWSLPEKPEKSQSMDEFFELIRQKDKMGAETDFPEDRDVDRAISVVFKVLRKYVSEGELRDIEAVLPKGLKPMMSAG